MNPKISLIIIFALVLGFSVSALDAGFFDVRGTVSSFDGDEVVVSTSGGQMRLPRSSVKQALRPGTEINVPVFGKTRVEVINTAPLKRELNVVD